MTDLVGKSFYIFTIFVAILHHASCAKDTPAVDQPVKGLAGVPNANGKTPVPPTVPTTVPATVPVVYMAEANITVGEIGLRYLPIVIVRSEAVNYNSYFYLELSDDDSRYAYLVDRSPYIPAHGTNTSTSVFFDESDIFFTRDSILNVTITYCSSGTCDVGSPRSTIITVKPEKNVNVSFNNEYGSGSECDCDGCCYEGIAVRTSLILKEYLVLPLLTGANDTATYNVDYSFDKEFVEPGPTVNLSSYDTYHYQYLYIKTDNRVEGTEYFSLRFDEKKLPDRVFVGSPGKMTHAIYDNDYGYIRIKNDYQRASEDVGTIEIIVETNIMEENKNLTLNVTIEPTYSEESKEAKVGEDYEPFGGFYVIPAGANGTTIPVRIINDDLAESEERLDFAIEALHEATGNIYSAYGTIYIEDDETRRTPLLFFFDTNSVTVNESVGNLEFYVRANMKNEGFVYLQYIPAKENGLIEYRDYSAYFGSVIKLDFFQFKKNMEYKIEVNILNDCDIEMTEEITLNISAVSIGSTDPEMHNLTIVVEDNDKEDDLDCLACSCGGGSGTWPTEAPTMAPEPEPLMFNFELDEFEIYEGECSFYDIDVVATRPTNATVFIGIQPWELEYGEDFTISSKKLVFQNNDRQNFSFRALQDTLDEDVESALISIAYASDGMIGRWRAILVHVLNENVTTFAVNSRSERSVDEPFEKDTRSVEFGSTAITTGLVAGLVSSLLVVMVTTILFGLAVVMRKPKQSS